MQDNERSFMKQISPCLGKNSALNLGLFDTLFGSKLTQRGLIPDNPMLNDILKIQIWSRSTFECKIMFMHG